MIVTGQLTSNDHFTSTGRIGSGIGHSHLTHMDVLANLRPRVSLSLGHRPTHAPERESVVGRELGNFNPDLKALSEVGAHGDCLGTHPDWFRGRLPRFEVGCIPVALHVPVWQNVIHSRDAPTSARLLQRSKSGGTIAMEQRDEVRIPPKRVRLVGFLCGSLLYLLLVYPMVRILLDAIGGSQYVFLAIFPIIGLFGILVAIPYFVLVAVWAFARLILNLPALILTPAGVVNHSVVYNVFVPWGEIEQLICDVPRPSRYRRGMTGNNILVLEKDERRLYEMQQPVTQLLLRLFTAWRPVNISTAMTAGTQAEVWAQLQRYVRKTLRNTRIQFETL